MNSPREDSRPEPRLDRRRVLGGVAAAGLAGPLLVACGSDDAEPGATAGSSEETSGSPSAPSADAGAAAALVATTEVPVGGGVVLQEQKVVVTQPTEGEFKAFSSVCTHQGCPVGGVSDGSITCPCHGSVFSAEDGSVVNGPAQSPLPTVKVEVKAGQVVRA